MYSSPERWSGEFNTHAKGEELGMKHQSRVPLRFGATSWMKHETNSGMVAIYMSGLLPQGGAMAATLG